MAKFLSPVSFSDWNLRRRGKMGQYWNINNAIEQWTGNLPNTVFQLRCAKQRYINIDYLTCIWQCTYVALLNPTYSWPAIFFTNSITLVNKGKVLWVLQHISDHWELHIHSFDKEKAAYTHIVKLLCLIWARLKINRESLSCANIWCQIQEHWADFSTTHYTVWNNTQMCHWLHYLVYHYQLLQHKER